MIRRLLNHVDQRFRFSFILGTGPKTTTSVSDFDDEDEEPDEDVGLFPNEEIGMIDMTATNELLTLSITRLRSLADQLRGKLHTELDVSDEEGDKRAPLTSC